MRNLRLGLSTARVEPVVRGLVSEAERVRGIIESDNFDVIGISIAPEELATLREGPSKGVAPSNVEEEVYMRELTRFGPVEKPPPCFVEALRVSEAQGVECVALDMDEEAFTDLYCREVKGWDLIMYSRTLKKLPTMSFPADSPEDLVREFDAAINRRRAYRHMEEAREAHMAASLRELCSHYPRPLALIETERFSGVMEKLGSQ